MSKAQRFVEVFTLDPRKHSLVGYEIVADNDAQNGRTLVLKKKEPQAQAPNAPVGKAAAAPTKKRHRRTKAELAAAGVKSRAAQSASSVATPALPGKPFSVLEAEAREAREKGVANGS